jgi:hypothetical protein
MESNQKNITPPTEFSGEAQLILYTRYGDPREQGFDNKWLNEWYIQEAFPWFPNEKICVHKHFRPLLESAFTKLATENLHLEIKSCDSCHTLRNITDNTSVLSVHSWGAAIDLNAADNPVGGNGSWSARFIEIMQENDIFCGQNWTGRKDPKHFAMVNG